MIIKFQPPLKSTVIQFHPIFEASTVLNSINIFCHGFIYKNICAGESYQLSLSSYIRLQNTLHVQKAIFFSKLVNIFTPPRF